jgi:transposase InsO family protein
VNEKRILRLMTIYQKPDTSRPAKGHKTYPYLLGGLGIDRPNQVWCADTNYRGIKCGCYGWPYTRDFHQPTHVVTRDCNSFDLPIQGGGLLVDRAELGRHVR